MRFSSMEHAQLVRVCGPRRCLMVDEALLAKHLNECQDFEKRPHHPTMTPKFTKKQYILVTNKNYINKNISAALNLI